MQTAFGYYRISDREQSNYSLSGQQRTVRDYSERKQVKLIGEYEDDGVSAASFNRPAWKQMVKDIRRHKPDFIFSTRYNRMSRLAGEGLKLIADLEKKYEGLLFISVEEMAYVDPYSPYFHKMRGEIFINSDFERRVISEQALFGRWSGLVSGRFMNRPPVGYLKPGDEDQKGVPLKDIRYSAAVALIGHLYFEEGMRNWTEIHHRATAVGFPLNGRSAIKKLLTNPLYYGLIRYPAYKREAGGLSEGLHQPYFPREWWGQINADVADNIPKTYSTYDNQLPLRPLLKGGCGHILTGGRSRSQNGTYIAYYKCNTCKGQNHNAEKLEAKMRAIVDCIRLTKGDIERITELVETNLASKRKEIAMKRTRLGKLIEATRKKIDAMDERFLTTAVIKESTYTEHRGKAVRDLNGYKLDMEDCDVDSDGLDLSVLEVLTASVGSIYEAMTPARKQVLVASLFGEISVVNGVYRTSKAPTLFKAKMLATNYLYLHSEENQMQNSSDVLLVPLRGANSNHVAELVSIAKILAA